MFCKFCGDRVDRKTMTCTNCGKAVGPLEGGIGFWDLSVERTSASLPEKPSTNFSLDQEIDTVPQKSVPRKQLATVLPLITAILSAACLVMTLVLIGIALSLKGENEQLQNAVQEITDRLSDQSVVSDTETLPWEETARSDGNVESEATELTEEPTNKLEFDIVKQPTDEQIDPDGEIDPDDPKVLFKLHATGEGLTFQWQKYNEQTEEWEDVNPLYYDVKNTQSEYGYDVSGLCLKNKNTEIYGQYRCLVTDADNNQIESESVYLEQLEESTESAAEIEPSTQEQREDTGSDENEVKQDD